MKTQSELKEEILKLNNRGRWEKNLKAIGLWEDILYYTSWMPVNIPEYRKVKGRVSYVLEDCPDVPRCQTCRTNFCSWQWNKFSPWCGIACRNKDPVLNARLSIAQHENAESRNVKRKLTLLSQGKNSPFQGHRHTKDSKNKIGNASEKLYPLVKERNGGIHPMDEAHSIHSKGEYEVRQSLIDFGIPGSEIEIGNRKVLSGRELDIYIPSHHFAIEYCGEFWHSEKGRPDKLHLFHKWKECQQQGIQLVCIFETEWLNRKYQILNLLKSKLSPSQKIPARKCEFVKLMPYVAKNFINRNHIQGIKIVGQYVYGLIYNGEIVAVMTFRLHHRNSKDIVLNRFCCVDRISVVGGASKLLKNAMKENNWTEVLSWSDNRWSNGNLYRKLGFELKLNLKPDYFYWDGSKILSKQSCTKKALHARKDQTEAERAEELGLFKIWDCGKKAWTYSI